MLSSNKCKMCGGDVEINQLRAIGCCQYCGTQQPLSKDDKEALKNAVKIDVIQKKAEKKANQKRQNKKWLPVLIIIIAAGLALTIFNNTVTRIYDVQMTSALDEYNDPVDEVFQYSTNADVLMVTARVTNAKNNTSVDAVWKCNGEVIFQSDEVRLTSDDRYIYFYIQRGKDKWAAGSYSVEIYLNDNEKPSKTVSFTVLE